MEIICGAIFNKALLNHPITKTRKKKTYQTQTIEPAACIMIFLKQTKIIARVSVHSFFFFPKHVGFCKPVIA